LSYEQLNKRKQTGSTPSSTSKSPASPKAAPQKAPAQAPQTGIQDVKKFVKSDKKSDMTASGSKKEKSIESKVPSVKSKDISEGKNKEKAPALKQQKLQPKEKKIDES